MITGTHSQHDLQFGSLDLIDMDATQGAGGFHYEVMATDADWGNPVPIEDKIISWLQDGAIVALRGYDNRDLYLKVKVVGKDGQSLALGEQALMFETGKPNTLTWTPPDGVAKPCVFGVITSHLEFAFDDMAELHLERTYGLRVTAEPFVRSSTVVQVSQAAPPTSPSVVSIDACTATTNWTGTPNAPTTSGGAVLESKVVPANTPIGTMTLKRSSLAVNMTGTPYLRVDWDFENGNYNGIFTLKVNGTTVLTPVAQNGNVSWYDYGGVVGVGTTLTSLEVTFSSQPFIPPTSIQMTRVLRVSDISRTDSPGDAGTNRELARTLAVAGSARTQGNLAVEDAAASLGTCLVYTCPSVPGLRQPNLRVVLTPGPTPTIDATTVSGVTTPLDTNHVFQIPIAGLQPGAHLILARVKHASSGARTIDYFAQSVQTGIIGDAQAGQLAFTSVAGVWKVVTVGAVVLPPTKIGPAGTVAISMTGSAGVVLDEAWVFNVETGRLTWIECGTTSPTAGGSSNRLWLDAPTVDSPVPAVYRGTSASRSDSQHAASEMLSFGVHEFIPPAMNVFTVTTNSTASTVTLTHYPRWHTHAAA